MNNLNIRQFCFALAIALTIFISIPAWSQQPDPGKASTTTAATTSPTPDKPKCDNCPPYHEPNEWFVYSVIVVVLLGCIYTLLLVCKYLSNSSTWSLSDALSEEVEVTESDKDSKPILKKMCASSSRLIALMGMIVIVMMFIGFGAFSMYHFAMTKQMPPINEVRNFLLTGLTLFAPYTVNKFSNIFESLSPK